MDGHSRHAFAAGRAVRALRGIAAGVRPCLAARWRGCMTGPGQARWRGCLVASGHMAVRAIVPVVALVVASVVALGASTPSAWAQTAAALAVDGVQIQVQEPRAYGHVVGDVVTRTLTLEVPRRLALIEGSLPETGRVGPSLELVAVRHASQATFDGRRHTIALDYQIFLAPPEPRLMDLPRVTLRFAGGAAEESLRVDLAPVTVSPIAPSDASPRAGLGDLRPDVAPPWVDTAPERWRLALYGLLALIPLAYLGSVHLVGPWRHRRQRPFARAERTLARLPLEAPAEQWLGAWRTLHGALDASAGRVLRAEIVDRFLAERPAYAAVRGDLLAFFDRSQALFFGGQAPHPADRRWLRDFCRRCFDIERGAA
jgi:mxaA protein